MKMIRTPDISRIGKASFTVPNTSGPTSTLQLRQKVKLDKITALYKHLNVTGDPDLVSLDRFMIKKFQKQATLTCFFSMVMTIGNTSIINVLVNF